MDLTNTCHRRPKSVNTTLPLSIVYVASAFGWRTWKQWRTTGDTGLRLGQSGTFTERVAGALFVTSVVATLAGSVERPRDPGIMRATGLALMTSGLIGTLVAQTDLGRSIEEPYLRGVQHLGRLISARTRRQQQRMATQSLIVRLKESAGTRQ